MSTIDDLPKTLRYYAAAFSDVSTKPEKAIYLCMLRAADEIERLRGEAKNLREECTAPDPSGLSPGGFVC